MWLRDVRSQHDSLDLVQVVGPSVINVVEEAGSDHGHHLQVGVIALQHSRLSTQRHTKWSDTGSNTDLDTDLSE